MKTAMRDPSLYDRLYANIGNPLTIEETTATYLDLYDGITHHG
jgi:hypothetical protein